MRFGPNCVPRVDFQLGQNKDAPVAGRGGEAIGTKEVGPPVGGLANRRKIDRTSCVSKVDFQLGQKKYMLGVKLQLAKKVAGPICMSESGLVTESKIGRPSCVLRASQSVSWTSDLKKK